MIKIGSNSKIIPFLERQCSKNTRRVVRTLTKTFLSPETQQKVAGLPRLLEDTLDITGREPHLTGVQKELDPVINETFSVIVDNIRGNAAQKGKIREQSAILYNKIGEVIETNKSQILEGLDIIAKSPEAIALRKAIAEAGETPEGKALKQISKDKNKPSSKEIMQAVKRIFIEEK